MPQPEKNAVTLTTDESIRSLLPWSVIDRANQVAAGFDVSPKRRPTTGPWALTSRVSRFHSEDKCRAYLEQLRWSDGVRCPRCNASKGISRIEKRRQFDCDSCGYQFSVRAGTAFHASHVPLWKWFLAVYVIGESKSGVSSNQLKHMIGVSYKTAWHLRRSIRAALSGGRGNGYPFRDTLVRLIGTEPLNDGQLAASG